MGVELAGCVFAAALAAHMLLADPCSQSDPFNVMHYLFQPDAAVSACISDIRAKSDRTGMPVLQAASAVDFDVLKQNIHLVPESIRALCDDDCKEKLRSQFR